MDEEAEIESPEWHRDILEERKKKIASEIKPILYKIKAGEMLLREGERVTDLQLLKLKAIQAQTKKEQILANSLGAALILACLLVTTYTLYMKHQNHIDHDHHKNLLFIASVFITFLFLAKISASLSESLAHNAILLRFGINIRCRPTVSPDYPQEAVKNEMSCVRRNR